MAENNEEFQDDFGEGMLYTLEDEDGNIQEFELLGELEYEGNEYCALIPYYENEEDVLNDDGEFVILKREMVDGEEMLATIDDDDEFEAVSARFMDNLGDIYEDDDEDETAPKA